MHQSADESHLNFGGERDVIRLRNPTEDKRAFRRMLTSADHSVRTLGIKISKPLLLVE